MSGLTAGVEVTVDKEDTPFACHNSCHQLMMIMVMMMMMMMMTIFRTRTYSCCNIMLSPHLQSRKIAVRCSHGGKQYGRKEQLQRNKSNMSKRTQKRTIKENKSDMLKTTQKRTIAENKSNTLKRTKKKTTAGIKC